MDFCIDDEICAIIQNSIKKLLQFIRSELGQILHVDNTGFLRPSQKSIITHSLPKPFGTKKHYSILSINTISVTTVSWVVY